VCHQEFSASHHPLYFFMHFVSVMRTIISIFKREHRLYASSIILICMSLLGIFRREYNIVIVPTRGKIYNFNESYLHRTQTSLLLVCVTVLADWLVLQLSFHSFDFKNRIP